MQWRLYSRHLLALLCHLSLTLHTEQFPFDLDASLSSSTVLSLPLISQSESPAPSLHSTVPTSIFSRTLFRLFIPRQTDGFESHDWLFEENEIADEPRAQDATLNHVTVPKRLNPERASNVLRSLMTS